MTKRLGYFLGFGFVGVVLLLAGLSWDAVLHSHDPTLAAREGVFAWQNPGHVLLGLGMGTVVVGLVGALDSALALAANPRWRRPAVHRAFLAGTTALVVATVAVTSWSQSSGHDPMGPHADLAHAPGDGPAAPDHGDAEAALPAPAASHDHVAPTTTAAGAADAAVVHDHPATADPVRAAAGGHAHLPATAPPVHDHGPAAGTDAQPGPAAGMPHEHQGSTGGSSPAPAPIGLVTEVRYGPFALAPAGAGGDLDHANVVIPDATRPCQDCFILGAEPDLIYPDGMPANLDTGVMLHHAVLFNTGRPDTTCGGDELFGHLGERFLASGNERTTRRYPDGFGYHLGHDRVNAVFHVMNHSSSPKTVYFTYKIRWVSDSTAGIRPLTPVWLDINNCRTSEYSVPAGPSSKHFQWHSTITGRIVATGGHVHDGGVRTTLTNVTTGQHQCTSWAGYGTKPAYTGHIVSMSNCTWDSLGTVRAGEVLDLEAVYNAAEPLDGVMGIMVVHVFETPDLGAGTPAPPDVRGEIAPPPASTPPPEAAGHHQH